MITGVFASGLKEGIGYAPIQPVDLEDPMLQRKADLLVGVFRFSQGSAVLGGRLLSLFVKTNSELFPTGGITEDVISAAMPVITRIRQKMHPDYIKIKTTGKVKQDETSPEAIRGMLELQINEMENVKPLPIEDEKATIAGMMLDRDANFLLYSDPEQGRKQPGRLTKGKARGVDMRFLSFYCYFGLAQHKPGSEDYERLLADLSRPEIIRKLPGVKLPLHVWGEKGYELNIAFNMDRFEQVLRTHFKHFPNDIAAISHPAKDALAGIIEPITADGLGLRS